MDVEQSVALQPVAGSVIRVYTIGFVCLVAESVSSYALFDIDIGIDRAIDFDVPGEGVVGACETTFVGENDNSPDGEVSRSVVEMGAGGILRIGSSHLGGAIAKVPNNTIGGMLGVNPHGDRVVSALPIALGHAVDKDITKIEIAIAGLILRDIDG